MQCRFPTTARNVFGHTIQIRKNRKIGQQGLLLQDRLTVDNIIGLAAKPRYDSTLSLRDFSLRQKIKSLSSCLTR